MFKKLFAILLALLMLCSCKTEEIPEPVLPEEPVVSENSGIIEGEENLEEPEETAEPEEQKTEINNGMELFAKEIYYSQKHDEYRSRIYARVASYKDGTFEETPNHHAPYPEDFPNVENLPGVSSETVALAWKNAEIIDETSEIEGFIEYLYFVDETHVIILTPVQLEVEEGIVVMTFAYTGYYSDENLEEWINTRYDGFFDGPFAEE